MRALLVSLCPFSFLLFTNLPDHPALTPLLCINESATATPAAKAAPTDWNLIISKGVINIYTRPNPDSGVKEVRVMSQVNTSLPELMALLGNVPEYPNWIYKCSAAKRLHTVSEQEFYYYMQTDMPFPVKDRDLVVHSRQWQDPTGVVYYQSEAASDFIPAEERMVRVKYFESSWKITPGQDQTVYIDYTVKTDPGGSIPVWIINLAIAKGPLKTMEQLLAHFP